MNHSRVIIFGDSLTFGQNDTEGGWVDRLKRETISHLVETEGRSKNQIFNLGIGGDTSRGILERFEKELIPRLKEGWSPVLIFAYGVNDSQIDGEKEKVPLSELSNNTQEIIKIARKYTDYIFFVEPMRLGVDELVWKKTKVYSESRIKRYSKCIEDILEQEKIPFIKTSSLIPDYAREEYTSFDKLHSNNIGHHFIAEQVKKALKLGEEK